MARAKAPRGKVGRAKSPRPSAGRATRGFRIDGARVRALRAEHGWTKADLAEAADVGERTLSEIELGESRGSPETARALGAAFNVEFEELWIRDDVVEAPPAEEPAAPPPPKPPLELPPAKLPAPTRLDLLAKLEFDHKIDPPPVIVRGEKIDHLTATRMRQAFASPGIFEGQRYFVEGVLDRLRALDVDEAKIIGGKVGIATRYHIVRDIVPGAMFSVTGHTAAAKIVRALHPKMHAEVRLVVRLKTVGVNDARVLSLFISDTKRAWGFFVEEVLK